MSLERMINREEAARILDVNPRTVQRYYAAKGLLAEERHARKCLYRRRDVRHLRKKIDAREELGDHIKEMYVMRNCGAGWKRLQNYFDVEYASKIKHAIEIYTKEREGRLKAIGIEEGQHDDYFMIEEVAARLRLSDNHAVYKLINEGLIDAEVRMNGKQKRFAIKKQSLTGYLGEYSGERLYRSHHVADFNHGMTVYIVDRVARRNRIGLKVKDGAQDVYLFSQKDIKKLREAHNNVPATQFQT